MALSPNLKKYDFWFAKLISIFCPCKGMKYIQNKANQRPMKIVND